MSKDWESHLEQWTMAGLLEPAHAARIRSWERDRAPAGGMRWPIVVALAFGAILLAAGVLLFVSAHWDQLSPNGRLFLVLLMVAVFHVGGAITARRFEGLSVALHAIGTVTLGAAIALAGQIYNLAEHWPSAILLWAAGAALAWALLRQWPQAALTAILLPGWLGSEWALRMSDRHIDFSVPLAAGACALSLTYLSARRSPADGPLRQALGWIGGIALLPAALLTAAGRWIDAPDSPTLWLFWGMAIALPLAISAVLRGRHAVWNVAAVLWTVLLAACNTMPGDHALVYVWCATGCVGLAWWGIRESRAERINLAIAGFAITVMAFYFSDVMGKLGRSASLMIMGLLFLGGGWLLERTRRGLLAHIRVEAV